MVRTRQESRDAFFAGRRKFEARDGDPGHCWASDGRSGWRRADAGRQRWALRRGGADNPGVGRGPRPGAWTGRREEAGTGHCLLETHSLRMCVCFSHLPPPDAPHTPEASPRVCAYGARGFSLPPPSFLPATSSSESPPTRRFVSGQDQRCNIQLCVDYRPRSRNRGPTLLGSEFPFYSRSANARLTIRVTGPDSEGRTCNPGRQISANDQTCPAAHYDINRLHHPAKPTTTSARRTKHPVRPSADLRLRRADSP